MSLFSGVSIVVSFGAMLFRFYMCTDVSLHWLYTVLFFYVKNVSPLNFTGNSNVSHPLFDTS